MGKTRDLFNKIRVTEGTFHASSVQLLSPVRLFVTPWTAACQDSLSVTANMGIIKDRKGLDLVEADNIKKRWQEYYKEEL